MISAMLSLIALIVAFFEALGFLALRQYQIILGIPVHFTSVQVFEFPGYGYDLLVDVLGRSPQLAAMFWAVVLVSLGLVITTSIQPSIANLAYLQDSRRTVKFPLLYSATQHLNRPLLALLSASLLLLCLLSLIITSSWTNKRLNDVLVGKSPDLIAKAGGKDSVELIFTKDAAIPKGLSDENKQGALTLLWQDDKAYYVSPVHNIKQVLRSKKIERGKKDDGTRFMPDWFAVERSQVLALKHSRQINAAVLVAEAETDWCTNAWFLGFLITSSIIAMIMQLLRKRKLAFVRQLLQNLRLAFVLEWSEKLKLVLRKWFQKSTPAAVATCVEGFSAESIDSLKLPARTWEAMLLAFGRGQDCILEYDEGGQIQCAWIRRESFSVGLRVKAFSNSNEDDGVALPTRNGNPAEQQA